MAPHLNNLYFLTLCQRHGAYYVIRLLFMIKLVLSCVMLVIGYRHVWAVGLFIARFVRLVYYWRNGAAVSALVS